MRRQILVLRLEALGEELLVGGIRHRGLVRILLVLTLRAICEIEVLVRIRQGCDGP